MNDPVDILAVAARLRDAAWQRHQSAQAMQSSPEAEVAVQCAKLDWMIADRDLGEVEYLAMVMRA